MFWVAVATVIIGLAIVPAMQAQEGGLDLDRHCREAGRDHAVNLDGTAYGWKCQDSNGVNWDISVDDACEQQHGDGARADFRDMDDEYSWFCQLSDSSSDNGGDDDDGGGNPPPPPPTSSGARREGMNLHTYCAAKGWGEAFLDGVYAGDWTCREPNGTLHDMDMYEACRIVTGLEHAGLDNGEDPNGWYCSDQPARLETPRESDHSQSIPSNNVPDPGQAFGNQDTGRYNGQCEIREFSLQPAGPYVLGQEVQVRLRSNCSTVRFSVNGDVRDELGAPDHNYTFRTNERGTGHFEICGEGRTNISWDNAGRQCVRVYVGPQWQVDEYTEPPQNNEENGSQCNGDSRLYLGAIAIVSDRDPAPLNVRHEPSTSSGVKFTVPIRELVTVISGPRCDGRFVWWEVGRDGNSGWAAEINAFGNRNLLLNGDPLPGGNGGGTVVVPPRATVQPPPPPNTGVSCPATQFSEGDLGRSRIDGLGPTTVRRQPGGEVVGSINEGDTFRVLEGTRCSRASSGNMNLWIQINASGTRGWIPEFINGVPTVEPWSEEAEAIEECGRAGEYPVCLNDLHFVTQDFGLPTMDLDLTQTHIGGAPIEAGLSAEYEQQAGSENYTVRQAALSFHLYPRTGYLYCYVRGALRLMDGNGNVIAENTIVVEYPQKNVDLERITINPMVTLQGDARVVGSLTWTCEESLGFLWDLALQSVESEPLWQTGSSTNPNYEIFSLELP